MSDYLATELRIGGQLTEDDFAELIEIAAEAGWEIDWNGSVDHARALAAILANRWYPNGSPLTLTEYEYCGDPTDDPVTVWCRAHRLSYAIHQDAKYEADALNQWWTPERGPGASLSDQDGNPCVTLSDLQECLNMAQVRALVARNTPPEIPPLTIQANL